MLSGPTGSLQGSHRGRTDTSVSTVACHVRNSEHMFQDENDTHTRHPQYHVLISTLWIHERGRIINIIKLHYRLQHSPLSGSRPTTQTFNPA